MGREQSIVRVIARGHTLVGDLSRARKNYNRHTMSN